jgi:hypothetical protein
LRSPVNGDHHRAIRAASTTKLFIVGPQLRNGLRGHSPDLGIEAEQAFVCANFFGHAGYGLD